MHTRNLILFNEERSNPVIEALEAAGYEVARNVWQPTPAQLQRTMLAWVNFYDCPKRPLKIARFRRLVNAHGVPIVAWNRDAPSYKGRPAWRISLLGRIRPLDIYMSHSLADGKCFGTEQLLLPNATDTSRYNLNGRTLAELADPSFYRYDVSFFGGLRAPGHLGHAKRLAFIEALTRRLDELGITHYISEGKELDLQGQIELIQRSRINLQYGATCEYPGHQAGGLPERCFGVPACGGFQLCDRRHHSQACFTNGVNYVEFDSLEDCVQQIQHYLAHLDEARSIADAGHQHVIDQHNYAERAQRVLDAVEKWRASHSRKR